MCRKHQVHCDEYRRLQESAISEWVRAETLHDVLAIWGRLGGRVTLHRYGSEHFSRIGKIGGRS